MLDIQDLTVQVDGNDIVSDVSLSIKPGTIHALMGPNGSGKSTLSHALLADPSYKIVNGSVTVDNTDVTGAPADERAREGLYLGFQYPESVPGITVAEFLREAMQSREESLDIAEFRDRLQRGLDMLGLDEDFAERHLNENFSGGEKKKCEILQMAVLEPRYAVLDEIDSGLDIDALTTVADGINNLASEERGVLLITHYSRILEHVEPDKVHVMLDGRIKETGGPELAQKLEEDGYTWLQPDADGHT